MDFRTVRLLALLLAGLAVGATPEHAQTPSAVARPGLGWLAGCWQLRAGAMMIEEQWLAPRAGVLLGVGRTTRGDSLVSYEFMRIQARGDSVVFTAQPSGQQTAEFTARVLTSREVVFENLAHDFPQRVRYRAAGTDSLHSRIEGLQGGQLRGIDFPYVRANCATPSVAR
ncbi:MAG: hypothetical protein H0U59_03715 [Gemmatimonadaceae bacterium]|nr:hypothetical protein [Gemmatimonadaceae bacterium]MDQ3243270.1 DUF6265 family protein [Gemmatimonadota bacterium]